MDHTGCYFRAETFNKIDYSHLTPCEPFTLICHLTQFIRKLLFFYYINVDESCRCSLYQVFGITAIALTFSHGWNFPKVYNPTQNFQVLCQYYIYNIYNNFGGSKLG